MKQIIEQTLTIEQLSKAITARYFIVVALTEGANRYLSKFQKGQKDKQKDKFKAHKELFVLELSGSTKVMYNCPKTQLVLARALQLHPNEILLWSADRITLKNFSDEIVEASKDLGVNREKVLAVPTRDRC